MCRTNFWRKKERKKERIIIIIIRNGANTICLGRFGGHNYRSMCTVRNICLTSVGGINITLITAKYSEKSVKSCGDGQLSREIHTIVACSQI